MTKEEGLILYNGPMGNVENDALKYSDYLMIYIKDGFVTVRMQFNGKNESVLTVKQIVTDGRFHTLTLTQLHKNLELVLDNCDTLMISDVDDSSCRNSILAVDDDERLNIVTPLQLGGVAELSGGAQYPSVLSSIQPFVGCIRKLVINGDHYDLYNPIYQKNSVDNCLAHYSGECSAPATTIALKSISDSVESGAGGCVHGECYSNQENPLRKCECSPGWVGENCDRKMEWIHFQSLGVYSIRPLVDLPSHTTRVQLLLLSGRTDSGGVFSSIGRDPSSFVKMDLSDGNMHASFQIGSTTVESLSLDSKLNNSVPYMVEFFRDPTRFVIF